MAAREDARLLRRTPAFARIAGAHGIHGNLSVDRSAGGLDTPASHEPGSSALQAGRHERHPPTIPPSGHSRTMMSDGILMMEAGPFSSPPLRRFRLGLGGALLIS